MMQVLVKDMKVLADISPSRGFTLIEVMVTMAIAMTILAGLLLNFTSQSSQYKYQDKRGDTAQDLEFALRFIARDIQSALVLNTGFEATGTGVRSVQFDGVNRVPTSWLAIKTWDEAASTYTPDPVPNNRQATRCYIYRTAGTASTLHQVYFNRHDAGCAAGMAIPGFQPVIGEAADGLKGMRVTHFRIFQDGLGAHDANRTAYLDSPPILPPKRVVDPTGAPIFMPAFTILIEVEVDAAPKSDAYTNVFGDILPAGSKKRLWRYMQVYPNVFVQ